MRCDIILAGVGGQGILSIAAIIDRMALKQGLYLKQAEVHGMAQRGGAVQSHLRLSDRPVASDLIPHGEANLLLSVEPMEALRYVGFLAEDGALVSSASPFVNISNYPKIEKVLEALRAVERHVLVDTRALAKQAGNARVENTVMLGAASPFLPLEADGLQEEVGLVFADKGEKIVEANLSAFTLGRKAALSRSV